MKNSRKIFKTCSSSAGFTLIELLIAMSLTLIVVSLAGAGLVTMMQSNSKAETETLRRTELNRALDFIADEVRMANAITLNTSTAIVPSQFSPSSSDVQTVTVQRILMLQITGVPQPVIYYIASPAATTPWLGPKVIYRWGPSFDIHGNYTNATTPLNWTYEPLVDLVVNSTPSPNPNCPTLTPTPTGWSSNPAVAKQGFYSCVDSAGRITEIHLLGKLIDAYGTSIGPYEVSTSVFARSATLSPSPSPSP